MIQGHNILIFTYRWQHSSHSLCHWLCLTLSDVVKNLHCKQLSSTTSADLSRYISRAWLWVYDWLHTIITDSLPIPFCLIVFSYCLVHFFVQQSRFGLCRLQWHSNSRITSRFVFLTPFYLRSKPYHHLFRSVWNFSTKYPSRNVLWCLFGYKTERWHTCRNHLTLLTPEHFL